MSLGNRPGITGSEGRSRRHSPRQRHCRLCCYFATSNYSPRLSDVSCRHLSAGAEVIRLHRVLSHSKRRQRLRSTARTSTGSRSMFAYDRCGRDTVTGPSSAYEGGRRIQRQRALRAQLSAAASRRRCSRASGWSAPSSVKIATITRRRRSRRSGSSVSATTSWRPSSGRLEVAGVPGGEVRDERARPAAPSSPAPTSAGPAPRARRPRSRPGAGSSSSSASSASPRSGETAELARGRRCRGRARAPCAATPRRRRRRACRPGGTSPSRNCSIWAGGIAPVNSATTWPSRNALTAGMPRISKAVASDRVAVGVDLRQLDLAVALRDRRLERRAERAGTARTTRPRSRRPPGPRASARSRAPRNRSR